MKQYLMVLLIGLAVLTLTECGGNTENNNKEKIAVQTFDSTDLPTEKIKDMDEIDDFPLFYNFVEGKSFVYRLTTFSNNKRVIDIDSVTISSFNQKITRLVKFNTVSIENDSIAELNCTITSIMINAEMDNQKFSYQSGTKLDSADARRFFEQEGLVNNPFSIRMTKQGELLDVFRVDGIINKLLELSGYKDSIDVQQKAAYHTDIVNNVLNPIIAQVFRNLPVQDMNVDSTWDKKTPPTTMMVFKMGYTYHFKIAGLEKLNEDKIAVINGVSSTTVEGETKHSNNGVNYEFDKPISKGSGKIYFNLDRGLIQKSKTKTMVELRYLMEMPTPQTLKKGSILENVQNKNILELL